MIITGNDDDGDDDVAVWLIVTRGLEYTVPIFMLIKIIWMMMMVVMVAMVMMMMEMMMLQCGW